MINKYPHLSFEAIQAMRAVNLLHDMGTYVEECSEDKTPQHFIRCAGTLDRPNLGFDRAKLDALAKEIRDNTGDEARYVMTSWHPDYGDYLRIRKESAAYQFICYLKS